MVEVAPFFPPQSAKPPANQIHLHQILGANRVNPSQFRKPGKVTVRGAQDDRNLVLASQVAMNRIWRFGINIWGF